MFKTKFYVLALSALMSPAFIHAELTVDADHNAVVDTSDLKLAEPSALSTIVVPTGVVAAIGALAGSEKNNAGPVALICGIVGGVVFLREYLGYKGRYDKANGLKLSGAAAANNEEGVKALLEYSKGWYLFKYNDGCTFYTNPIGSPLETDSAGKTALHYGAAANGVAVLKAIVAVAPKEVTDWKVTGKSNVTTAPTTTVKAGQSTTGGIAGALVGLATGTIKKEVTTTTGGAQEKVDTVVITQKYVDLKDDGDRNAVNWAARTGSGDALLFLGLDRGSDINLKDKSGKSAREISQEDEALKAIIARIEGK